MYDDWLNHQFNLHPNKTKASLAKALGLESPAISKILNGTRQVKADEYNKMRIFFGLPVDGDHAVTFLSKKDSSLNAKQLTEPDHSGGDWVMPQSQTMQMFQIPDHAMEPDYQNGQNVMVDTSCSSVQDEGVFVISDKFGYVIRHCKIIRKGKKTMIEISSPNPDFKTQVLEPQDFKIIGRVAAKLEWV